MGFSTIPTHVQIATEGWRPSEDTGAVTGGQDVKSPFGRVGAFLLHVDRGAVSETGFLGSSVQHAAFADSQKPIPF